MKTERWDRPPSSTHNNADLITWATDILGGRDRWVDVEQIYLKAFEIAPARLSWRTRPDLPDYKKCAKALQELESRTHDGDEYGMLIKHGAYQRKLSVEGASWCDRYRSDLEGLYGGVVPSAVTQDDGRRIRKITNSPVFARWKGGEDLDSTLWELSETLECLSDSSLATWEQRIDAASHAAHRNSRTDVVTFMELVRRFVREQVR